jgi:hypothetical protein
MIEIVALCINVITFTLLTVVAFVLKKEVKSVKKQLEKDERVIKSLNKVLKEERSKNI